MTTVPDFDMKYISQRPDGSYQLRIPAGKGLYGRRQREYETVHGTPNEARNRRNELLRAVENGAVRPTGNVLIKKYLSEWHHGRNHLAPLTSIGDEAHVEALVDALRALRLHELRNEHLEALVDEWRRRGSAHGGPLSAKTICNRLGVLRTAVSDAVAEGRLTRDPIRWEYIMPRYELGTRRAYEPEEIAVLFAATTSGRLRVPVRLAGHTGARRGEVLGLRLRDIDIAGRTIHIEGQLQLIRGQLVWRDPKSQYARRALPLSQAMTEILEEWLDQRGLARRGTSRDAFVFAHPDGHPWRPDGLTTSYRRLTHRLGLEDTSFHTWRHTYISYQLVDRMPLSTLAKLAGHKDGRTILSSYAHIIKALEADLARPALGSVLEAFR